jgi:hypothetical protein
MTTMRTRLFLWLMPSFTIIIILLSIILYFNAHNSIFSEFVERVTIASKTSSQLINIDDKDIKNKLIKIQNKLDLDNIYILIIDPPPKHSYDSSFPKPHLNQFIINGAGSHMSYVLNKVEINSLYREKKSITTKIYENIHNESLLISSFSPITNKRGDVIAVIGSDINATEIANRLYKVFTIIIFVASVIILIITMILLTLSKYMTSNIKKMKNKALSIAAGNYTKPIKLPAPKELVELAETLNTISEGLQENILHMRQDCLLHERLYGEQECAHLLQQYMVEEIIKEYSNPKLSFSVIRTISSNVPHGVLVDIKDHNNTVLFTLAESRKEGFKNIYKLISEYCYKKQHSPSFTDYLQFQFNTHNNSLTANTCGLSMPLIWSQERLQVYSSDITLHAGDMVFITNHGFDNLFKHQQKEIVVWFDKVLKHFGNEGVNSCMSILSKELSFITRKLSSYNDAYIIGIEINA